MSRQKGPQTWTGDAGGYDNRSMRARSWGLAVTHLRGWGTPSASAAGLAIVAEVWQPLEVRPETGIDELKRLNWRTIEVLTCDFARVIGTPIPAWMRGCSRPDTALPWLCRHATALPTRIADTRQPRLSWDCPTAPGALAAGHSNRWARV